MFLDFWEAQDQKMRKCVCEISSYSHCMVSVTNTLSASGWLHEQHSLTRHWHQWGFMAKMSLTNFIKSVHKRAWCFVNNTFLFGSKRGILALQGGVIRHSIFNLLLSNGSLHISSSKRYLLCFSFIMTSDPTASEICQNTTKKTLSTKSQPAKNFHFSKFI